MGEDTLLNFFLGPFLTWIPRIIFGLLFVLSLGRYLFERKDLGSAKDFFLKLSYKTLIWIGILFHFVYAALLSLGQYVIWSASPFTKSFLETPLSDALPIFFLQKFSFLFETKLGYFFFYSWGHFWLVAVLSVLFAWAFFLFLRALKKHKERFFEEGETELGFLCALIVGWPHVILFIPFIFISVIFASIGRMLFLNEKFTTLGIPFLLAALLTFLFWNTLDPIFGLWVLRV